MGGGGKGEGGKDDPNSDEHKEAGEIGEGGHREGSGEGEGGDEGWGGEGEGGVDGIGTLDTLFLTDAE